MAATAPNVNIMLLRVDNLAPDFPSLNPFFFYNGKIAVAVKFRIKSLSGTFEGRSR